MLEEMKKNNAILMGKYNELEKKFWFLKEQKKKSEKIMNENI